MQNKEPQIYQTYIQCVTLQRVPSFFKGGAGVVCSKPGIQIRLTRAIYHIFVGKIFHILIYILLYVLDYL